MLRGREKFISYTVLIAAFLIGLFCDSTSAIQCYQCDSAEDGSCPQWWWFDKRLNALVDCGSFEARVPGMFCAKIYQESSGWGRWIKITRRCASRTETGVAWGCRYEFDDQGVYRETCYCQDRDGCNSAPLSTLSTTPFSLLRGISLLTSVVALLFRLL